MRTWKTLLVNVAIVWLVFAVGQAMSQDKGGGGAGGGGGAPPGTPDMAEMMKKWIATTKPGPSHKWLDQFVGKWTTTTRMWMGGPGAPPAETKGSAEIKWVLDGRWLMQEAKGEMLMPDASGQMKRIPYSGMGLTGYDNFRRMYVGNWHDNITTAMLTFTGNRAPDGNVLTMYGEMDEPMLDTIGRTVKYVTKVENEKKFVFTVYDLLAGDNFKVFEITYERQ